MILVKCKGQSNLQSQKDSWVNFDKICSQTERGGTTSNGEFNLKHSYVCANLKCMCISNCAVTVKQPEIRYQIE